MLKAVIEYSYGVYQVDWMLLFLVVTLLLIVEVVFAIIDEVKKGRR